MLIGPGLHLVLSGRAGFDLSDPLDCSAFAFETGAGLVLFDAGVGRDAVALSAALSALPGRVSDLFLTHAHADHAGGAAHVRAHDARVHAGAATARIVAAGDEDAMSLPTARAAGIYPPDYRFAPCAIDEVVRDGVALTIGTVRVLPIATPGHSADHLSYLVTTPALKALVCGDALFHGGRVVLQDTWDCSVPDTCRSVRRLAEHAFDAFLPGHGAFSLADGRRHVAAALARVERLLCPEPFF